MTRYTYLQKRRGTYYIRVFVPTQIRNILKKSEISYSLKTKDYREAVKRLRVEILKVDKMFENSKNNLHILTKAEAIKLLKERWGNIFTGERFDNIVLLRPTLYERHCISALKLPSKTSIDMSTDIWRHFHNIMQKMDRQIDEIQKYNGNFEKQMELYDEIFEDIADLQMRREENTIAPIVPNIPQLPPQPIEKHKWLEVFEEFWLKKINNNPSIRENAKSEYLSKFETIFSLLQIDYIEDFTEDVCLDFIDRDIYRIPKRKNRDNKRWLRATDIENEDRLSPKTLSTYKSALKQLLEFAQRKKYIPDNIADILEERSGAKKDVSIKREGFSDEELLKIFNPETYPNKLKDKTRFWIPLWALYSGARLNEICQLKFEDIRQENGIWCFDINENAENKSIKNASSKRLVPIHPFLIKLGLLEFIKNQEIHKGLAPKENKNNIFFDLKFQTKNGYGGAISTWFARYLKNLGLKRPELTFHSFRHTVASRLANLGVSTEIRNAISGWTQKGTGERFYTHYDITTIYSGLEKIKYEAVEEMLMQL